MSRHPVEESAEFELALDREDRACPKCGGRMHVRTRRSRSILTLEGPLRLSVGLVQCGAVVLDFCSAVRGILDDNHGGPCNPAGIRMVDALADVQDSLARIPASGKSGPSSRGDSHRARRSHADPDARRSRSAPRRFHRSRSHRIRHGHRSRKPARISATAWRYEKSPFKKKKITPESIGSPYPQSQ